MVNVYNPHSEDLSIQYLGVVYSLKAGETKALPEEVALYWKEHIHNFLELSEVEDVPAPAKRPAKASSVKPSSDDEVK